MRAPCSRRAPKLQAVLDGETDVALVHSAPRTPGLAFTEVSSEPWRAVGLGEHPSPVTARSRYARSRAPRLVLVEGGATGRLR